MFDSVTHNQVVLACGIVGFMAGCGAVWVLARFTTISAQAYKASQSLCPIAGVVAGLFIGVLL